MNPFKDKSTPSMMRVLLYLCVNRGFPRTAKRIADACGIMDNTCNKDLKFLRDSGYLIISQYAYRKGEKQRYKEHFLADKKNYRKVL